MKPQLLKYNLRDRAISTKLWFSHPNCSGLVRLIPPTAHLISAGSCREHNGAPSSLGPAAFRPASDVSCLRDLPSLPAVLEPCIHLHDSPALLEKDFVHAVDLVAEGVEYQKASVAVAARADLQQI